MAKTQFTAEFAHECFTYYPDFGWLIWKERPSSHFPTVRAMRRCNTIFAGKEAGSIDKDGYRKVSVAGVNYQAHRVIWLLETGSWPDPEVDHEDGDPSNNRWTNLVEATHLGNMKNKKLYSRNTTGWVGVYWDKREQKWRALIGHENATRNLGYFPSFYEALLARWRAEKELGYHENHGRR